MDTSIEDIYRTVTEVRRERWIEAEQHIDLYPDWFYKYREFLHTNVCVDEEIYADRLQVYKDRDPDEDSDFDYSPDYKYAKVFKGSPKYAYIWAQSCVKGRCTQAEKIIIKDPWYSYLYARDVIKGRWKAAEMIIAAHVPSACCYARDVIRGRWVEAEILIETEPKWHAIYREIKPTFHLLPKPLSSSGWKPLYDTELVSL